MAFSVWAGVVVVKQPVREVDSPSRSEVKNEWRHTLILPYTFMLCRGTSTSVPWNRGRLFGKEDNCRCRWRNLKFQCHNLPWPWEPHEFNPQPGFSPSSCTLLTSLVYELVLHYTPSDQCSYWNKYLIQTYVDCGVYFRLLMTQQNFLMCVLSRKFWKISVRIPTFSLFFPSSFHRCVCTLQTQHP